MRFNDHPEIASWLFRRGFFYLMIGAAIVVLVTTAPFYTVQPGFDAIHMRMGRIIAYRTESGMYYKYPLIDSVAYIDTRIQKSVIKTEAFSHDLQTVNLEVAINYTVLNSLELYKHVGTHYESVVIDPLTQESVKAIIAKFTAEDLTQHRDTAKEMVKKDLKTALEAVHIKLIDFNFIHADFHDDFIKAVENKQIAEQQAKQAKFTTDKVKEEALQTKVKADALAYSMGVQRETISDKIIELRKIEKWDGILPKVVTTGNTLLTVGNI